MLQTPREIPVKEDSIIDLLQNSEIEFATCPKPSDNLEDINTGFGENNDLYYDAPCTKPALKTPLYQENYLTEFITEEEKAAARHALGLYNKGDVVLMSLLTAEDSIPSQNAFANVSVKHLRKGDKFFAPVTVLEAVFGSDGIALDDKLKNINQLLSNQQKEITKITQVSNSKTISSLGDIKLFLEGFENGNTLRNTLDTMDQTMLRFEKTGNIN